MELPDKKTIIEFSVYTTAVAALLSLSVDFIGSINIKQKCENVCQDLTVAECYGYSPVYYRYISQKCPILINGDVSRKVEIK